MREPRFEAPTKRAIETVLRAHPLIRLREKVVAAYLVGSFAKGAQNEESDVDILLEVHPKQGWTSAELEDKYRQRLRQYFVTHNIAGKNDALHPQWCGRRVDLYLTYDASSETRPKVVLRNE